MAGRADELGAKYGNVTKPSVGAIQRSLLILEQQGAANFFSEPALELADLMRTTRDGRGAISVLAADKLMMNPRLYATFLLWLMSELFEQLPRSAIRPSRNWSSSSTRRICSSMKRQRR
jgi:DNA helicase HerA-like ATPase